MKSLFYIANVRIPTEKAHGIQIAKMCEALANFDIKIELIIPKRKNFITESIFNYYGVKNIFSVKKIFFLDFIIFSKALGKLAFFLESFSFAMGVYFYTKNTSVLIYPKLLQYMLVLEIPTILT